MKDLICSTWAKQHTRELLPGGDNYQTRKPSALFQTTGHAHSFGANRATLPSTELVAFIVLIETSRGDKLTAPLPAEQKRHERANSCNHVYWWDRLCEAAQESRGYHPSVWGARHTRPQNLRPTRFQTAKHVHVDKLMWASQQRIVFEPCGFGRQVVTEKENADSAKMCVQRP